MDTLTQAPERQVKTPIARGYMNQLEVISSSLSEQLEDLLSLLSKKHVALAVAGLKDTPFPQYDAVGYPMNVYYFSDIARYKYGWKVYRAPSPESDNGEWFYIKDLTLFEKIEVLKSIERCL